MTPIPAVLFDYIAGLKTHDVERIADTLADEVAFVTAARTLAKPQILEMLKALYTAFPDWHYDHDEPERRDGVMAVRWRQGGTHLGTFAMPGMKPVAATGKRVTIPPQHFFYTVSGARIVEIRPDPIAGGAPRGILEQIGVDLPPL